MARLAIYIFFVLLATGVYAENIKPDEDTDFPSLGDTSDGLNHVALPPPPPKEEKIPEIPSPLAPYINAVDTSTLSKSTPAPPSEEPEFTPIPSLALPEFEKVQSLNLPKFATVPSLNLPAFEKIPDIKFTGGEGGGGGGGGAFEQPAGIGTLTFSAIQNVPKVKTAASAQPFVRDEAGGGAKASGGPSTPTPSPLAFPSFGTSSTPLQAPFNPTRQQPYTWGLSSTPIANPLAPNPITPVPLTPYVWGQSSSPRSTAVPLNVVTPYMWGQSSTPIATVTTAPYWGRPSTPTANSWGQSSTPQGVSSTPQGVSSTPHGQSSTPSQGLSSTPRGR